MRASGGRGEATQPETGRRRRSSRILHGPQKISRGYGFCDNLCKGNQGGYFQRLMENLHQSSRSHPDRISSPVLSAGSLYLVLILCKPGSAVQGFRQAAFRGEDTWRPLGTSHRIYGIGMARRRKIVPRRLYRDRLETAAPPDRFEIGPGVRSIRHIPAEGREQ